jgi:hypothetical protein
MAGDTMYRRVELIFVGEGGWRVCDATLPEDDARRVVAFFEKADRHIEVLWIWECHAPRRFDTLNDALDAASAVIEHQGADRSSRPVPIRHFPPHSTKAIA